MTQLMSQYEKQIVVVNHSAPLTMALVTAIMQYSNSYANIIAKQQMESMIRLALTLISMVDEYIAKRTNGTSADSSDTMNHYLVQQFPIISRNENGKKVLQSSSSFSATALPQEKISEIIKELHLTGGEDFHLILSVAQLFDKLIFKKVYGNKF